MTGPIIEKSVTRRRRAIVDRAFGVVCAGVAFLSVAMLALLMWSIGRAGIEYIDWSFLTTQTKSIDPVDAGFLAPIMGSIWVCAVTAGVGLPLGIGAAVYLHEFAPRSWLTRFIQINISNLAGVPSVVYGLIGLAAFVSFFNLFGNDRFGIPGSESPFLTIPFGRTVLSGGLTLMLVVLPIVIIATQEALRAVPDSLREGALAMGATRWQMVRRMVLPCALPGIMTGSILAMSRAIGETAPILVVGGALIAGIPNSLASSFTAMPIQIYHWTGHTNPEFQKVAASGIIILLGVLLIFNAAAIIIRAKFQKPLS